MGSGKIRTDPGLDREMGVGRGSTMKERWGKETGGPCGSAFPAGASSCPADTDSAVQNKPIHALLGKGGRVHSLPS